MLSDFDIKLPATLEEALKDMAASAPNVAAVAGGTNVVPDLRSGRHTPPMIVDISHLKELKGISLKDGKVRINAGTTIADLLHSDVITEHAPSLFAAAKVFASPLVRNRATIGGNIADASPAGDTIPPLLALGAEVELTSVSGCRLVPLDGFFLGVRRTVRKPDEILTAVLFPAHKANSKLGSGFSKVGLRKADAISVISTAVAVELDDAGNVASARIALGSVAPTPVRAKNAEAALIGKPLSAETIEKAAELAVGDISPIDDLRASADYRRHMARVLVRRLLTEAGESMKKGV